MASLFFECEEVYKWRSELKWEWPRSRSPESRSHISRSDGDFQERLSLKRVFTYYSDREGGGEERRAEYVWLCDCLV